MGTGECKKETENDNNKYNKTFFEIHDYIPFLIQKHNDKKNNCILPIFLIMKTSKPAFVKGCIKKHS